MDLEPGRVILEQLRPAEPDGLAKVAQVGSHVLDGPLPSPGVGSRVEVGPAREELRDGRLNESRPPRVQLFPAHLETLIHPGLLTRTRRVGPDGTAGGGLDSKEKTDGRNERDPPHQDGSLITWRARRSQKAAFKTRTR